jgi:DNA modification methylase
MTSALIAQADCFRIPVADKSVHCVVTSPPYFGLRKYSGNQGDEPLGLEPTPERHIERTIQWAREVYRVLRDDGVFWLNYGDCYAGSWGNYGSRKGGQRDRNVNTFDRPGWSNNTTRPPTSLVSLAQGNLMLMPHRIALALQADGWIVRQDLVWAKPNPMPESVAGWRWQRERQERKRIVGGEQQRTNIASMDAGITGGLDKVEWEYGDDYELRRGSWRHTRAHEYVFQLTKGMGYWSDREAVRELLATAPHIPGNISIAPEKTDRGHMEERVWGASGRNPRSVLHIPTAPYKGAHYATFPPALIAPLILATCPRWCCPVCGQGWAPVVEHSLSFESGSGKAGNLPDGKWAGSERLGTNDVRMGPTPSNTVLGHRPTCDHPHTQAEAVPGIVCDPFVGSGTTVMVAKQLLRRGVGFDLSLEYLNQQATLRTGAGSRTGQLDNLPLLAHDETEPSR